MFLLFNQHDHGTGLTPAEEDEWMTLFDGKTLNGWEKLVVKKVNGKSSMVLVLEHLRCSSAPKAIQKFSLSSRGPH